MKKMSLTGTIRGLLMCVTIGLFFGACSTADNRPASNTSTTTTTTTNNGNATTTTTTNTTTTTSGNRVGVAECDDYLDRYEACLNRNVPENMRATMRASLESTRNSWRTTAATPQGRAGLEQACRQARDAARQQMSAYNCSWE